ncbi:hypothetical protein PUNSTDRAFT_75870, partial [Punctularia strigosozonata HHB-11173 SS5]
DEEWCSDYMVSSYTPTIGALLSARQAYTPIHRSKMRALVAAVPRSSLPRWADLLSTRDEVGIVRDALPEGVVIPLYPEDDALTGDGGGMRAETLLENLPQANILHLACHGHQNAEDPLKSGFVMRDEMLTIERLTMMPLPNAFLGFLSACETAKGDKKQPDQIIHLAATMLFAGFKSVIATLWSMEDVDGPLIAKSVYRDIFDGDKEYIDPDDVAYALDRAVQALRRTHPDPCRWAPYIHLGI